MKSSRARTSNAQAKPSPKVAAAARAKASATRSPGASKAQPSRKPTPALIQKAKRLQEQLAALYPAPPIPLSHSSHFQLLIAVMLSAQTTDRKVNEVTPALFSMAPDATALALCDVQSVEATIRQVGLAPTKAKNIVRTAQLLVERHGGGVPDTFDALEALPGVGHKTASVVMVQCHGCVPPAATGVEQESEQRRR
jgi:adenine-specific DNA glycosylase